MFFCLLIKSIFFLEFFYITAGINHLLLSCEEWVTLIADINVECVALAVRLCFKSISASTYNGNFMIIWMYFLFHVGLLLKIY